MRTRPTRLLIAALSLLFAGSAAWALLYHECASGGAMGGWYQSCTCRGIERVDFDHTAVDGAQRTICVGWVATRRCYRNRGGVEIPCTEIKPLNG
ncbi:MAG: hypothetical protein J4A00_07510 [Gammaproteobacteria bacterium]|nr:hypothetical protein [Gammaproteobacteria bacterium]